MRIDLTRSARAARVKLREAECACWWLMTVALDCGRWCARTATYDAGGVAK